MLVVVLLGGGAWALTRDDGTADDAAAATTTTVAPTTTTLPEPVELQLEAVGVRGPDPFTDSVAVAEVAVATDVSLTDGTTPDGETNADGTQPGLYGGTRSESCNTVALVEFLQANPDKAAAWASVFGIGVEAIPDFVAGLTPVVLRVDTRVTNHGFGAGTPTAYQAVLQSGTAVLVDRTGVPRVKCNCGNPLAEPGALPTSLSDAAAAGVLTTSGTAWDGFDPTGVVIVTGGASPLNDFTVVDVTTGETYTTASGSVVTTTTTAPPTTRPPTTRPPTTRPPTTTPPTTYEFDPENPCGMRPGPRTPRATC